MRGKPETIQKSVNEAGITPAHAGKTQSERRKGDELWDHPRACGENRCTVGVKAHVKGSPPRMRGKPCPQEQRRLAKGITPAHAGKTLRFPCQPCHLWDHPRACGENSSHLRNTLYSEGSPPRMRGKLFCLPIVRTSPRITPAHAGKTFLDVAAKANNRDHPRACGENKRLPLPPKIPAGSPPRMRGKPCEFAVCTDFAGITPAHAGKTC